MRHDPKAVMAVPTFGTLGRILLIYAAMGAALGGFVYFQVGEGGERVALASFLLVLALGAVSMVPTALDIARRRERDDDPPVT